MATSCNALVMPGSASAATPVVDAECHHLNGCEIILDRYIFIVRMHHGGGSRPKYYGRCFSVEVQEPGIGRALPAAYFRLAAGYFRIIFTHRLDDRMFDRNFGGLGVVTDEPYLRRMVFHPRIFRCGLRDMLNQAALHTFMIFAGNRRHAALQE